MSVIYEVRNNENTSINVVQTSRQIATRTLKNQMQYIRWDNSSNVLV